MRLTAFTMATPNPAPRRVLHDPLNRREFMKITAAIAAGWTLRAPSATATPSRPNIVVIVSDQHRRTACGCFGSPIRRKDGTSPTPNIDALAAQGVAFDAAYCAAPLCAPSRASYMTGVYPHTTTALYHQMLGRAAGLSRFPGVRREIRGMGEYFRDAGYRTATVGKVHVHGETRGGWDLGFDFRALRFYTVFSWRALLRSQGRRHQPALPPAPTLRGPNVSGNRSGEFRDAPSGLLVEDNTINQNFLETLVETPPEMFDHVVADCSMSFIDQCHSRQEPFFIHVGFEKPHEPWTVHQKYLDLFAPENIPLPATIREWQEKGMTPSRGLGHHRDMKDADAKRVTAAYYACAGEHDEQVGRVVAHCRETRRLDNTVFIYASDHGEMMFDHGLIYKHNMFEQAVGVPFILSAPGLPRGTRTQAPLVSSTSAHFAGARGYSRRAPPRRSFAGCRS